MARYLYAWTPLVNLGTVALLTLPWLGLLALVILSLFAHAAWRGVGYRTADLRQAA
jgi:hypothetical protein